MGVRFVSAGSGARDVTIPTITFFKLSILIAALKDGVKNYKRKFDRELKHVKIILTQERQRLSVDEWLELVKKSRESILNEPETFFGDNLPSEPVLREAIDKVFESFLEDQRLLANQTEKRFRIPLWVRTRC